MYTESQQRTAARVAGLLLLATFSIAVLVFPGAEDTAAIAFGRFVPVFFFEVILGGWLLARGVRLPAERVAG